MFHADLTMENQGLHSERPVKITRRTDDLSSYPEREWQKFNTHFLHQNRLKPCHYRELLNNANLKSYIGKPN